MIVRIVKMTFRPEGINDFLHIFEQSKELIRGFEGCEHLELLQHAEHEHVFFTYSWWRHPDDLEAYRHSALFKEVWANTKALFGDKPEAWSLNTKVDV